MKRFINIYITLAMLAAYLTTRYQLFPATVAIRQIMDEKGDFRVIYIILIVFGFFILLLGLGLGIYYLLKHKKENTELIDEPDPSLKQDNTTP